jgi:hypothetical protein
VDLGLTQRELPIFPDPLVKIGYQRFNSVLGAMYWAASLWVGPGEELKSAIDGKRFDEVDLLPVFYRFFCHVIKARIQIAIFRNGYRVDELDDNERWPEMAIEIDDRICIAGIVSEIHRLTIQYGPPTAPLVSTITKAVGSSEAERNKGGQPPKTTRES